MFRLLRFFSIASLILMVLASIVISGLHQQFEKSKLLEFGQSHSETLMQTFTDEIWPQFRNLANTAGQLDADALRRHPDIARLSQILHGKMRNTHLLKLNIIQMDGRTLFSTDTSLIGSDESSNVNFIAARNGRKRHILADHDRLIALNGVVMNFSVLESHVPLRSGEDAPIEGVLQIYTDVTEAQKTSEYQQLLVTLSVVAALAVLYGIFFFIVKYADGIIRKQVEQQRQSDQTLHHMSTHDALTDLPNRVLLLDRIKQLLHSSERRKSHFAVAFIDLDNFKNINDSLGHHAGDKVLLTVAQRLSQLLRKSDTVARLGGDEFVITLPDIRTGDDAVQIIRKVLSSIALPIEFDGRDLYLTGSIGIALYPEHGQDVDTLMRNADMAMYSAKKLGRNRHQMFIEHMSAQVQQKVKIENEMRHALDNREFVLYYQPIIDMKTGLIVGAEALMRWPNAEKAWLSPSEFIPIAEESGLIIPLSEWALGEACDKLQSWRKNGLGLNDFTMSVNLSPQDFTMAVNLSPRHFASAGLAKMVANVIEQSRIDPNWLHLEITEGLLMGMNESVRTNFDDIRKLGIKFSIDDFGTGYSSLGYLKRFAIHLLKVDRSFVHDLPDNADSVAIVTAIVALANSLGLTVIAEGIETEAQLELLQRLGCHQAQGYLFSHPVPAAEFLALALERRDMRIKR